VITFNKSTLVLHITTSYPEMAVLNTLEDDDMSW